MRKTLMYIMSSLILITLALSACGQQAAPTNEQDPDLVNTMVALAFTQTAVAQPPVSSPSQADTPTPEPVTAEEVTETSEVVEETAAPTEVTHQITPGEPGWVNKWFYDTNSALTASQGYVTGGDDYVANLYERPFTETQMIYRSDLDIQKAEISSDNNFYYVSIYVDGYHPDGGLQASYGVEIDEDRDGRGDLVIIVDRPVSTDWDIAGVTVRRDENNDVGGATILRPDANYTGDSYETLLFSPEMLDDPDMAWARVTDANQPYVTLAFKKSILTYGTFVWGVWTGDILLDPGMMDLHDFFTQEEAGSPYSSHTTYPLKAINLVDNTCRETYGFDTTVPIPGLCFLPEPTPTNPPVPTNTYTPSPIPVGNIYGTAFDDSNNDGIKQSYEGVTIYSVTITLRVGSCSASAIRTTTSKQYNFTGLTSGTYCVKITGGSTMTTPSEYLVLLPPGGSILRNFGFYVIR